jgi:hypothetical protein
MIFDASLLVFACVAVSPSTVNRKMTKKHLLSKTSSHVPDVITINRVTQLFDRALRQVHLNSHFLKTTALVNKGEYRCITLWVENLVRLRPMAQT